MGVTANEPTPGVTQAPPIPEASATELRKLLKKKLGSQGLAFSVQAYIAKDGKAYYHVAVDNTDDPDDFIDYHILAQEPKKAFKVVRKELDQVYDLV